MTGPEKLTGREALEATKDLVEEEVVFGDPYITNWSGESDGFYYLVTEGWFSTSSKDDEGEFGRSALRFPDRTSRDAWIRENAPIADYRSRGWMVQPPEKWSGTMLGIGSLILDEAGRWLDNLSESGTDCSSLNESDLQQELCEQISNQAASFRSKDESGFAKEVLIKAKGDAPGSIPGWNLGPVDLVVDSVDGPVWIELKWAKSYGTLFNCLWDAAKLAGAVRSDAAVGGYLVAGAPASEWEKDHPYQNLFSFHSWEDGSIVTSFAKDWKRWLDENPDTFPSEVVDPIQILPFGFVRGGPDDWEIRVARVVSPGDSTLQLADLNIAP